MILDTMTPKEIYEYVSNYALERYEDGWDIIYECWGTGDLCELIRERDFRNMDQLIRELDAIQDIQNERRREIQSY